MMDLLPPDRLAGSFVGGSHIAARDKAGIEGMNKLLVAGHCGVM
jgi:hypothetical protein